jgi:hypothetical protein
MQYEWFVWSDQNWCVNTAKSRNYGTSDPQPCRLFYVAGQLGKCNIAFICAREAMRDDWYAPKLRKAFGGVYIANEGFTKETAEAVIAEDKADAVALPGTPGAGHGWPDRPPECRPAFTAAAISRAKCSMGADGMQ